MIIVSFSAISTNLVNFADANNIVGIEFREAADNMGPTNWPFLVGAEKLEKRTVT